MKQIILFTLLFMIIGCNSSTQKMDKKTVIAHRGASGYLPEHTLESKKLAHEMNADFIEQDLVLSKDNVPIVIHDIYLGDVTDIAKKFPLRKRKDNRFYVIDFTFEELKTLRVTERFNPKTGKQVYPNRYPKGKGNFKLHSLQEEIELIQKLNTETGKNIGIYPEIKAPEFHLKEGKDISVIVLKTLSDYGYTTQKDNCILQCFDEKELERIRTQLHSKLFLVQLLDEPNDMKKLKHYATFANGIGPWYGMIVREKTNKKWQFTSLVSEAHQLGLVVHPYTFRADDLGKFETFDELLYTLLIKGNVDGVFTDFPDKVIQFLSKK